MNPKDEYWFWLSQAITSPSETRVIYFYDIMDDILFAVKIEDNNIFPAYRNSITKENEGIKNAFSRQLSKVASSSEHIIQLPHLTLESKRAFFYKFIGHIKDTQLHSKLTSEINSMTERDPFNFKTNLKEIDPKLFYQYEMEKGKFITSKIKELYSVIGITEDTTLIW